MTLTEQGIELAKEQGLTLSAANTILSPGKFEGEHVSTLVFWESYLNGSYDDDNGDILTFSLTEEERQELGNANASYRLRVSESGFVYGNI